MLSASEVAQGASNASIDSSSIIWGFLKISRNTSLLSTLNYSEVPQDNKDLVAPFMLL